MSYLLACTTAEPQVCIYGGARAKTFKVGAWHGPCLNCEATGVLVKSEVYKYLLLMRLVRCLRLPRPLSL